MGPQWTLVVASSGRTLFVVRAVVVRSATGLPLNANHRELPLQTGQT
jgi:hypothetical protein